MKPKKQLGHFIAGRKVPGKGDKSGDIFNPSTGVVSGEVCLADNEQTDAAVAAARQALPGWMATPPGQRARIMFAFRELLQSNLEELAFVISSEHGKTIADARGELQRGLEVVDFACTIPELLKGNYSEMASSKVDCQDIRQPIGVCVGITPFNFPAMVPLWMFPVAICCGNTFVLKPSEKVPSCSLLLAEMMQQAGLPDGVLNIINGNKDTVTALLNNKNVAAVSFVGSTGVGKNIHRTASLNGKRVQALCGAKNHMLVMPDADLQQAADAATGAAYGSAGERCMAISVVVTTDDSTADKLTTLICAGIDKLKIGVATEPDVDMGPVINQDALARIVKYIELGVAEGAELLRDGRNTKMPTEGFFMGATLFDKVKPGMRIHTDEIFGPVLGVVRADSYQHALHIINDHNYGNGAAIFTRDGYMAKHFCGNVQAGMVGINVPIPVPPAHHSFGGWKGSMFGDYAIYGSEGVRFYTKLKTVSSRWSAPEDGAIFHFKGDAER